MAKAFKAADGKKHVVKVDIVVVHPGTKKKPIDLTQKAGVKSISAGKKAVQKYHSKKGK
jgi:HSP20 family molecular chaperone IbpA